ncbi:MAG: IMPACT family protein [Xanthomonadales bacterium]|nr:IMPACT family protein [Xanthomonadales bacterium]
MLTLKANASFEEVIKKSRFIGHTARVSSLAESLDFYESVIDPQATHNCWAWRINFQVRSSDDGEPSGTAGRPMLNVIERRNLENVMVVVTRYFGGIKLGVGGLVRAYSGTTAKCLDRAGVIELFPMAEYTIKAGFELASSVHGLLDQFSAEKLEESYDNDGLVLKIRCRETDYGKLAAGLRDTSRGQIVFLKA